MSRPMFDEMNASASSVRPHYEAYQRWLAKQPADAMQARRAEAEMIFRCMATRTKTVPVLNV